KSIIAAVGARNVTHDVTANGD
ncbi:unnamed protein product, partial [Allacma fusca]